MKKLFILIPLIASCQSSDLTTAGAIVGDVAGVVARYECARLSPDVALNMLCVDASGVVVSVAVAKAKGILATRRITKG